MFGHDRRALSDRRGASLTGYGLLLGLIAIAAIAAVGNVGDEVSSLFGAVSEQMESASSGISGSGAGGGDEEGEDDSLAACIAGGVGTLCADGSYYVGSLDEEPRFMTSSAYQSPTQLPWSPGSSGDGSQITHSTDGKVNVATMKSLFGEENFASNFPAASYCDTLTAHGREDWYLPAGGSGGMTELNLLWEMVQSVAGAVDGIGSDNTLFWSSSEAITSSARIQRFDDGERFNDSKSNSRSVRCFRRPVQGP